MRWAFACVVCAVSAAVTGAADARARATRCAMPEEVSAIRVAAVQQELMVAALTCHEIGRYNDFQTGYGPELRTSDARLLGMFRRLYGGRRGEAAYHAFKTKLANDSEMRSIHDNPSYCLEAGAMLTTALATERPTLEAFARNLTVTLQQSPADGCVVEAASSEPRRARHKRRHKD
jgi:hypothetical protein